MNNNKQKSSRFYLVVLTSVVLLLLFVFIISSSMLIGYVKEGSNITSNYDDSTDNDTATVSDIDSNLSQDVSDVFAETSVYDDNSFEQTTEDISKDSSEDVSNVSESSDDTSDELPSDEDLTHGWVINQFGYTYIYGDTGYEQFNYKNSSMERYINCINDLFSIAPQEAKFYNIIVPISTTFASIPREIYTQDNFYNQSQSSFVSTVNTRLNEEVTNIPLVSLLEEKYDKNEYLYFRTDKNWTSLGAYYAYIEYCNTLGIAPYPLEHFKKLEAGEYLGSFYNATDCLSMKQNPDEIICYTQAVNTAMTIYDNDRVFTDYMLCSNTKAKDGMYEFYFGKEAARYEIFTTENEKSLLIIGDSSVCPMIPYLISHYNKIDVINPEKFDTSLVDFFTEHNYDDIITMCYSSNAINGEYIPGLKSIIGVQQDAQQ